MKYMGSKRWMLQNGLGMLLSAECADAKRFVDLFAGSGAVAHFVAQQAAFPVLASDLQMFSVILTEAIIARDKPLDVDKIWKEWFGAALRSFPHIQIPELGILTRAEVAACRDWSEARHAWLITHAYGGHYFSPLQATWIDILRRTIPEHEPARTVALAALISAASRCAASPGHTAQPFQPTRTAKRFLREAWNKDITVYTQQALKVIAPQHARMKGRARVADANAMAKRLQTGDLAFIDPPYSGVQYSRFYHVLETIARGTSGDVSGVGRYPASELRPQSKFSLKKHSLDALQELLKTIAERNANAILTFPDHNCSNGLSGEIVKETAAGLFRIKTKTVDSKFSTLGGNSRMTETGKGREARQMAKELILILTPKKY
jgi:adenine-specific DNA methylase